MNRFFITILILILLHFICANAVLFDDQLRLEQQKVKDDIQVQTVKNMINRLTPSISQYIVLQLEQSDIDFFEVFSTDQQGTIYVTIRGNNGVTLASGFGYYLENYLHKTISFTGNNLADIPTTLVETGGHILKSRFSKYTYYQNVCTLGYTMAWWGWNRWEQEIDWMALKGINLPLMFVGQEYIFRETFKYFGVPYENQTSFYSGPGFLPWNRMGNIKGWAGPLPNYWIVQQLELGKQILQRMIDFGMSPVLPAFAGHVPDAFAIAQPQATVIKSSDWAKMPEEYSCVSYLQPSDPLYPQVQAKFIELAIQFYNNTAHFYNGDQYNEMTPTSTDPNYIKQSAQAMINGMLQSDPSAVWVMQGWLFENDKSYWTDKLIEAYLSGVSNSNLLILDLWSDENPVWSRTQNYYGKNWIWCMLHDFGGNMGLFGKLYNIMSIPYEAKSQSSTTLLGIGLTMEGTLQNYVIYDGLLTVGWNPQQPNIDQWLPQFIYKRYGQNDSFSLLAWQILKETVYSNDTTLQRVTKNQITRVPVLDSLQDLGYDFCQFSQSWFPLLTAGQSISNVSSYSNDIADIGREVLADLFLLHYKTWINHYNNLNVTGMNQETSILYQLINDEDRIMGTIQYYMLGDWINQAQQWAQSDEEMILYKFNSINQVTLWGPDGQINDYAAKEWNGLLNYYYYQRYDLFFKQALAAAQQQQKMNYEQFLNDCLVLEKNFQYTTRQFPSEPLEDPFQVSQILYNKWTPYIKQQCQKSNSI